jgi:magnesium transporter
LVGGEGLIADATKLYLRDCYDHTIQIMDLIESYRDMTASMLDIYLSSVSNRLNETMRVLTVIATIFIPPTFLASVYGMNFDRGAGRWNMPELGWAYGYPALWVVMLVTMVGMLVYFKRKKWF